VPLEMTEGNYYNVGHRGPVYKGLGAMNPCDNLHLQCCTTNLFEYGCQNHFEVFYVRNSRHVQCLHSQTLNQSETPDTTHQSAALWDAIPGLNRGFLYFLNMMQLHGTPSVSFHVHPQDLTAFPTAVFTKIALDRPL
jgi:hypothetical protein